MSVYNPNNLACHNPSDTISFEDFSELELANIIYVSKTSAAGATIMYCIDPDNFSDATRTNITIHTLFNPEHSPIPNFNCDDLNSIRLQLSDPGDEILQVIDNEYTVQGRWTPAIVNDGPKGPSKGFMLFLRGVICCLKKAQEKAGDLKITKIREGSSQSNSEQAEEYYRYMLMYPLLRQIRNKIDSLSELEISIIGNLPFPNPRSLYANGRTLSTYIDYQIAQGHCGASMIGDLCDFYNFNKRKYFSTDTDIVGVRTLQPCAGEYVSAHCVLSEYSNSNFTARANNFQNSNYNYHSDENVNNISAVSYAETMRTNN